MDGGSTGAWPVPQAQRQVLQPQVSSNGFRWSLCTVRQHQRQLAARSPQTAAGIAASTTYALPCRWRANLDPAIQTNRERPFTNEEKRILVEVRALGRSRYCLTADGSNRWFLQPASSSPAGPETHATGPALPHVYPCSSARPRTAHPSHQQPPPCSYSRPWPPWCPGSCLRPPEPAAGVWCSVVLHDGSATCTCHITNALLLTLLLAALLSSPLTGPGAFGQPLV